MSLIVGTETLGFLNLLSKSFAKIIMTLTAVLITFLVLPQTRTAAMLGVAVLSSIAGGLLVELFSLDKNWTTSISMSIAFGVGFAVYPILMMFNKFYALLNADDGFYDAVYSKVRTGVLKKVDTGVDALTLETKKSIEVTETTKLKPEPPNPPSNAPVEPQKLLDTDAHQ